MANAEFLEPTAGQDELQSLRERVSELDEQVRNLQRLEVIIRRNNDLFEALLAASMDGVALTRTDGTIIRVVKSVLGYAAAEAYGRSVYDFVHPEDRQSMRECFEQIVGRRAHQVRIEVRMLKPGGSIVWIEDTITDMIDDPNVLAIVHNYRDVTERKTAESAAQELAALIQVASFAFFSKDPQGRILSWNSGAERSFGYTRDEIVGQHISMLVPAGLQADEQAMRSAVVQNGKSEGPLRTVRIHKNGSHIPVEVTLTPLMREGRVHAIVHLSQLSRPSE